jgi:hypothetical protein
MSTSQVVKERHPEHRREHDSLLSLLSGVYLIRLKQRRPESGPPWILRQLLQPDVLQVEGVTDRDLSYVSRRIAWSCCLLET